MFRDLNSTHLYACLREIAEENDFVAQNERDKSYAVLMLLKRGAAWADFLPV